MLQTWPAMPDCIAGVTRRPRMDSAKIIVREMQRYTGFQVRLFLAERIGEPRESAHRHTHSQVLSLHKRSADMPRIRIALSDFGYNPRDAWWGVSPTGSIILSELAEQFGKLREIDFRSKAFGNGDGVVVQPVCRELHAASKPMMQVPEKFPRIGTHSLANAKRRNEFGFAVDCDVNPLVTNFGRVGGSNVPALLADVAPDFVNLQISGVESAHPCVHQSSAAFPGHKQESHDGVAIEARKPLRRSNGAALKQAMQSLHRGIRLREKSVSRELGVRLRESILTGSAFPALNVALAEGTSLNAGRVLASDTSHGLFSACVKRESRYNEFGSESRLTPRFGLAPQPVQAGYGAIYCDLTNWWRSSHVLPPFCFDRSALQAQSGSYLLPKSFQVAESILPFVSDVARIGHALLRFAISYKAIQDCAHGANFPDGNFRSKQSRIGGDLVNTQKPTPISFQNGTDNFRQGFIACDGLARERFQASNRRLELGASLP
jgi:hypothetical protein